MELMNNVYDTFLNIYEDEPAEVLSTGIPRLDRMLDGGIKKGSIIDIRGRTGSGKSLLAISIIKSNPGKTIIYVNANKKYNKDFLIKAGVNTSNIVVIDTNIAEDIFNILFRIMPDRKADIVVIDDIASLKSKYNDDERVATLLSERMKDFSWCVSKYQSVIILINQNRNVMGQKVYIAQKILNKKSSYIFECLKRSLLRYENEYIGQKMGICLLKPVLENDYVEVRTFYNKGIDERLELIEFSIEIGLLEKRGNWIFFQEENLGNGIYNAAINIDADKIVLLKERLSNG